MIWLVNVTRFHGSFRAPRLILDRVSLRIDPLDRVGILAASGTGKSTVSRLISGHELPDDGLIVRDCRLSWPLGFSSAFHPSLTVAQNVANIAGLWNADPMDLIARVQDFSQIGASFSRPMNELAPGLRAHVAMALSLSTDFDLYLADDMNSSANRGFREKCEVALMDRLKSSGLIMLSRHPRQLEAFATRIYVLANASLIECENAAEAADILDALTQEEPDSYAVA